MKKAAAHYGYHVESLRQRLRVLREEGKVSDIGDAPSGYSEKSAAPVKILWANPKSMMMDDGAPKSLFDPTVGRHKK